MSRIITGFGRVPFYCSADEAKGGLRHCIDVDFHTFSGVLPAMKRNSVNHQLSAVGVQFAFLRSLLLSVLSACFRVLRVFRGYAEVGTTEYTEATEGTESR